MPYLVDPTRSCNWKTRTLLLLWFMQSWGQGYIIGGVELRLVTQKCVPYFFDQSPLSNSSCAIGNSEWNKCRSQIVAVASTSDNNQQEVFVFYNSFFMVDSRIERLPVHTTTSVSCCIVLSHREVECLLSGVNGSVTLDPLLMSVSFPNG